jgi:type II secretion system protein L
MDQRKQLEGLIPLCLRQGRMVWYPPGSSDTPRPLDDDIAREQLRATLSQHRGAVCFAAPGSEVRLLTLSISPEERKHIARSLPFTLEEQVAEDIDELHFASRPLGKFELAVAVCSRDRMAEWLDLMVDYPGVQRWVPEPLLLPWQPGEWCLLLEDGRAMLRCGECAGFSIERELAALLLEQQAGESGEPDTIVIYGDDQAADTALLPETLRGRVQWRRGTLGSALMLTDRAEERLNLLQGPYAPKLPLARWWRQWRAAAALFAAAFALQLLSTWADYRELSQQNLALRAAIEESYRQINPRGAAPQPERQLERLLASLQGSAQTGGFVSLVEQVGEVIAARPGTSIASINYNDRSGEMRMNIIAADFETVESIRQGINQAGLQAEMESSNAQSDGVRARIRVGGSS